MKNFDLGVIYGGPYKEYYEHQEMVVGRLYEIFSTGLFNINFGFVYNGDISTLDSTFKAYSTKAELDSKLTSFEQKIPGNDLENALKISLNKLFRHDVTHDVQETQRKLIVFVTQETRFPSLHVKQLNNAGVEVIVVAFGDQVDIDKLNRKTKKPNTLIADTSDDARNVARKIADVMEEGRYLVLLS